MLGDHILVRFRFQRLFVTLAGLGTLFEFRRHRHHLFGGITVLQVPIGTIFDGLPAALAGTFFLGRADRRLFHVGCALGMLTTVAVTPATPTTPPAPAAALSARRFTFTGPLFFAAVIPASGLHLFRLIAVACPMRPTASLGCLVAPMAAATIMRTAVVFLALPAALAAPAAPPPTPWTLVALIAGPFAIVDHDVALAAADGILGFRGQWLLRDGFVLRCGMAMPRLRLIVCGRVVCMFYGGLRLLFVFACRFLEVGGKP